MPMTRGGSPGLTNNNVSLPLLALHPSPPSFLFAHSPSLDSTRPSHHHPTQIHNPHRRINNKQKHLVALVFAILAIASRRTIFYYRSPFILIYWASPSHGCVPNLFLPAHHAPFNNTININDHHISKSTFCWRNRHHVRLAHCWHFCNYTAPTRFEIGLVFPWSVDDSLGALLYDGWVV